MSQSISNVEQTEFNELVKLEYQSTGFTFRDTFTIKRNIVGGTVQFRKAGTLIANLTGYQQTIPIQDPNYQAVLCVLNKYNVGSAVDTVQELTVNFDEKMINVRLTADAIGRRSDQVAINALVPGAGLNPDMPGGIAAAGSNMTYSKLRDIVGVFIDMSIPEDDRFLALSGRAVRSLMADDHIMSSLYSKNDLGTNGRLNNKEVLGLTVKSIPIMPEGGLPLNGTIRTGFAWHRKAIGMAIGKDLFTKISHLPREDSWFINGGIFLGCTIIDNRGLIGVYCDESVNP